MRLAPDKSSVNISSCSEDTSKEEVVIRDSTEEIIVEMKDETEEPGETVSEAVINCDENVTLGNKGKVKESQTSSTLSFYRARARARASITGMF